MAAFDKYYGQEPFGGILHAGARGVDIFFLISGFIITVVSLNRDDLLPRLGVYEFARRRVMRILPMMWVALSAYIALRFAGRGDFDLLGYARAATLWPVGELNPSHFWTLRVEAFFYLIFALTMLQGRWLRLLMPLWVISPYLYVLSGLPEAPVGWQEWVRVATYPAAVEFGSGMLIALLWMKKPRSQPITVPMLFPVLLLLFVVMTLGLSLAFPGLPAIGTRTLFALAYVPIMLLAIYGVSRESKVGSLLGSASYVIYLFHPHFISAGMGILSKLAPYLSTEGATVICALVAIAGAVVIHLVIERPLLHLVKDIGRRRVGTQPEQLASA